MQALVRKAKTGSGAGHEVLDENIRPLQQLAQNAASLGMLGVESEALFRAVHPSEMRGESAHTLVISAGKISDSRPLNLDDTGPDIGQLPRTKRSGNGMFQRYNRDAIQGAHEQ